MEAARRFVAADGGYRVIYLHSDVRSHPPAERFWRSLPTREIYDGRDKGAGSEALHFELEISASPPPSGSP